MPEVLAEGLLDLLDDALDEIENGVPDVYTAEEQARSLRCLEHWLDEGQLTEDDVAFLFTQLHAPSSEGAK
jgi:hypothetical protein